MRRPFILMTIALAVISVSAGFCRAESKNFTSKELIISANTIDGSMVSYKGEVITAIMNRGEHSWVNLSDGDNAIGVWCESDSLAGVRTFGGYKYKGDVLEVEGIFHRACPIHGGELDIHADRIVIAAEGFPVNERIDTRKTDAAIVLFILALLAVLILRKRL